jgi:hypothetical protein
MRTSHCTRAASSQLRYYLLISSVVLVSAATSPTTHAGPLVIEETAKLTSPDPAYAFPLSPAVGGNSIIIGAARDAPNPEFPDQREMAAFLFERNASGAWQFVRKMTEIRNCNDPSCDEPLDIAMNSNVAAIISGELRVFERTSSGWVSAPTLGGASNGGISVHSGMILAGHNAGTCSDGRLFQKVAGTWTLTRTFVRVIPPDVEDRCGDIDASGGEVDISGNRVIVSNGFEAPETTLQIWNRNADGSWPGPPTAMVPLPLATDPVSFSGGAIVAIEGNDALANSGSRLNGPHLLRYDGLWTVAGGLQRPDRAMFSPATGLQLLNGFAVVGAGYASSMPQGSNGAIAIFQRNVSGGFDYVAQLVASDGFLFGDAAISGRRIVASGREIRDFPEGATVVYVFDLPADFSQPELIQDGFQDRNVAEWTQIPGSVVSVPSNGLSFFYRQSSVAGDAGSLRTGVDMRNQAIEADVVGRTFASGTGERWFGLVVRQTDPGNLYYLTLRNNNTISLRKRVNGVVTVLASQAMPVLLNRRYKLHLEAIGSRISAYVDGQLRLQAVDRSLQSGTAGLRMFRTATDYDNVVISPNPQTALLSDEFGEGSPHEPWWFPRLGTWSEVPEGDEVVFAQTSLSTDGRITTDIDADDQVVQARARADQFAPGDRWFGLVSRLQDDENFYYLTVRSSNSVSLRKLVNGRVFVLDSASFPVSAGTWYTLRLEAVGNALRGYVNGRPLVESIDGEFAAGTYGLATSRATASFDNFRVTQP